MNQKANTPIITAAAVTARKKTINRILLNSLKYGKGITLELDKEERSTLKYLVREFLKLLHAEAQGDDEESPRTPLDKGEIKIVRPNDLALFAYEEEALKRVLQKISRDDLIKE